MNIVLRLLLSSISVIITAWILPGVHIESFITALLIAVVLSLLNVLLKPLLILLTVPLTIITLGFFLLVINTLIIIIASNIVTGFIIDGFWWAFIFSILLSIISSLLGIRNSENN